MNAPFAMVLVAIAAAVLLCGSSRLLFARTAIAGSTHRGDAGKVAIIVPQYRFNETLLFDEAGEKLGMIPGASGSAATDAIGTLYISTYHANFVRVYAPPYAVLQRELRFNDERIEGVVVDAASGVFAVIQRVTNAQAPSANQISFYERGANSACAVIPLASNLILFDRAAAFDRAGNLFYTGDDLSGFTRLIEIAGGCRAKTSMIIANDNNITPSRLAFNKQDDIVIQDFYHAQIVYTFAHPRNGQLGQPIAQTVLNRKVNGFVPDLLVLTPDGSHLWAGSTATTYDRYSYPNGGNPVGPTLHVRDGGIMAVVPAEIP